MRRLVVPFRRSLAAVALLLPAAAAARAQTPARYLVTADTLRYEIDNPFRMYWLPGADTVGPPQRHRTVESHAWRGAAAQPEVVIAQLSLDVGRETKVDTFTLRPDGRVVQIDRAPPTADGRFDLLLQLPAAPLAKGTRWADTLREAGRGVAGDHWYEVARAYEVERVLDTLGGRVADVVARGTVRMRFGFWVDSAAGRAGWIDVSGPVTEHYLFDVTRGRLVRRRWDMDLHGRGVAPTGPDTVPAGLRSVEELRLSDSPRLRFLLAPLPGADTSVTVDVANGGAILLHTVDRSPDRISSGFARNDGMVGVATAVYAAGRLARYEATWADTTWDLMAQRVAVRGDSLVLARSGQRDTAFALPGGGWGVADYAMQEQLVPLLLALPRDGAPHPFSVFRPVAAHWDEGTAFAQERGGLVFVALRFGEDKPELVVLTPEGDYLFGENSGPVKARRVPVNAARQQRLRDALEKLNAGGTPEGR